MAMNNAAPRQRMPKTGIISALASGAYGIDLPVLRQVILFRAYAAIKEGKSSQSKAFFGNEIPPLMPTQSGIDVAF